MLRSRLLQKKCIKYLVLLTVPCARTEIKIKDGLLKKDIIGSISAKKMESSFRRRLMYNLGWINKEELNFLEFAWFLRNCMHNDFSSPML